MAGLTDRVRQYRSKLMTEFMTRHQLDALALSSADWFEWAANHEVREQSWERPFVYILTAAGKTYGLASEHAQHGLESAAASGALWIEHIEFYSETPCADVDRTLLCWSKRLAKILSGAGLNGGRVGADIVSKKLKEIGKFLPGAEITSVGSKIRPMRWVKHAEEIAAMQAAAALSDWVMEVYEAEIEAGRLIAEMDYSIAARASVEAASRFPGENYQITSLNTLSGSNSACPKGDGVPTGKVVENDTVSMTTIASRLNGLSVELGRTWIVGDPSANVQKYYENSIEAQKAAIEACKAGNRVSDIHTAAHDVYLEAGLDDEFRLRSGHGIGVVLHDFPEDLPFENRQIRQNEVFAIEPALFVKNVGGFRFADTIAATTNGPKPITTCVERKNN